MQTDVDCGGSSCPACTDGSVCGADSDCASSSCYFGYVYGAGTSAPASGVCVSCSDGVRNGAEVRAQIPDPKPWIVNF